MIFALIGLAWITITAFYHLYPEVLIGFGFIGFDLVNQVETLKTQLWAVGKAIRDEMKEHRK